MSELLPCPFCGYKEPLLRNRRVVCYGCGASTMQSDINDSAAIAYWNRRVSPWISVKERMPEEGSINDVITDREEYDLVNKRFCDIVFSKGRWKTYYAGLEVDGVTHYKPIPQPPKEGV